MSKKINVDEQYNSFKIITEHLHNQLKNDGLPSFDEAELYKLFGRKLNSDVLTALHKEVKGAFEKLNQDYKNILAGAVTKVQGNFDPKATANYAQQQFELKLDQTKQTLINKLNDELANQRQELGNLEDKEALDTDFRNYLDNIGQKYKDNISEVSSIWSKLAKFKLHISNEEAKLKAKDPNATFSITETDLDKLSIGITPNPSMGWKIDIDNLVERLMHRVANQKPVEKIHIVLNIPDRNGIISQIGDIGFQGRSGTGTTVALAALLLFYILALIRNVDVERMVTAFENVIKEKGIAIDPKDISYMIKQLNNNGKSTVIKEKGPLSSEHTIRLQQANQELKENLRKENEIDKKKKSLDTYQSDEGYDSGSESEEQAQEKNLSPRPRL